MLNYYFDGILLCLFTYITGFTILNGHKQKNWSEYQKMKMRRIYYSIWLIPYTIYLSIIILTPETRPFFFQHIFLGLTIHFIMALFGRKATIF